MTWIDNFQPLTNLMTITYHAVWNFHHVELVGVGGVGASLRLRPRGPDHYPFQLDAVILFDISDQKCIHAEVKGF